MRTRIVARWWLWVLAVPLVLIPVGLLEGQRQGPPGDDRRDECTFFTKQAAATKTKAATDDGLVAKVYSLDDIYGGDGELITWIVDNIQQLFEPGSWSADRKGPRVVTYGRIMVVYHTPAVQAKIATFLDEMTDATHPAPGKQKSKPATPNALVPTQYAEPAAVKPVDPTAPVSPYLVPSPAKQPKHLFHLIIRYEGEGIIDSNVVEYFKSQGSSPKHCVPSAYTQQPILGSMQSGTYGFPPMPATGQQPVNTAPTGNFFPSSLPPQPTGPVTPTTAGPPQHVPAESGPSPSPTPSPGPVQSPSTLQPVTPANSNPGASSDSDQSKKKSTSAKGTSLPGQATPSWANVARHVTNEKSFQLPIEIASADRASVKEVILYVKEPGGEWAEKAKAPPTQKSFKYDTNKEGEYWFSVVTVDQQGRMHPADVASEAPNLIVVVDHTAPTPKSTGPVSPSSGPTAPAQERY